MNSEFIFTGDLPRQTISDRVQRGQLRPLATGVYTADLTSTPEAIVAQDRHIIVPATTFGQWLRSDDGDPIAALRF